MNYCCNKPKPQTPNIYIFTDIYLYIYIYTHIHKHPCFDHKKDIQVLPILFACELEPRRSPRRSLYISPWLRPCYYTCYNKTFRRRGRNSWRWEMSGKKWRIDCLILFCVFCFFLQVFCYELYIVILLSPRVSFGVHCQKVKQHFPFGGWFEQTRFSSGCANFWSQ